MQMGENAISPMWKKHQNLLSNNNDAPSITKCGFLVRPDAQIVAPRTHCVEGPPLVVAWPCPVCSRGCCRLARMLYTMV